MRLVIAIVIAVTCGCSKRAPVFEPGPPPPHVLSVVTIPSLPALIASIDSLGVAMGSRDLREVALFARKELVSLLGMTSIEGFDESRPLRIVMLHAPGEARQTVLIAGVRDARTLTAGATPHGIQIWNGWAAIGPRTAVDATAPWALTELIARPVPATVTAEIDGRVLAAAYGPALQAAVDRMPADDDVTPYAALRSLAAVGVTALAQVDRLVVRVRIDDRGGTLDLDVHARPDTELAQLASQQVPATFDLVSRLPAGVGTTYIAGRFTFGRMHRRAVEMLRVVWFQPFGRGDGLDREAIDALFAGGSGDLAAVVGGPFGMSQQALLYGLTDPAASAPHLARVLSSARGLGTRLIPGTDGKFSVAIEPEPVVVGGVPFTVSRPIVDVSKDPPEIQQAMAIVNDARTYVGQAQTNVMVATGVESRAYVAGMLAGGAAPSAPVAGLVEQARAEGASALFAFMAADGTPSAENLVWVTLRGGSSTLRLRAGAGSGLFLVFRGVVQP